jgi:hypothetical protein
MGTFYTPLTFFQVVTGIGECIRAELAATDAGAPERVCLSVPGAIAWDGCDCGQLALTVNRIYGSRTFPAEGADVANEQSCGMPLAVADVTVSVVRCVAGPDDQGNPPSCEQLLADARTWHADVYAVRHAVACCLRDMVDNNQVVEWQLNATAAAGPEGLCAGSTTQMFIGLDACLCPPGS